MHSHLRSNRRPRIHAFTFLGLISVLSLQGCNAADTSNTPPTPPSRGEIPALSAAAEKELTFSNTRIAVVFAIDGDGKIQAFRRADSKTIPLEFPLHAEQVAAMSGISLIRTTNPKACWMTTLGDRKCVSW